MEAEEQMDDWLPLSCFSCFFLSGCVSDSREAETKGATVLRTVAMRLHVRFLTDMTSLGAEDTALWICLKWTGHIAGWRQEFLTRFQQVKDAKLFRGSKITEVILLAPAGGSHLADLPMVVPVMKILTICSWCVSFPLSFAVWAQSFGPDTELACKQILKALSFTHT